MPPPFHTAQVPVLSQLSASQQLVAGAIMAAAVDADEPYAPQAAWRPQAVGLAHCGHRDHHLRLCHILAEERPMLTAIPQDLWASALPRARALGVAARWFTASRATVIDLLAGVESGARLRVGIHQSLGPMTFDETLRHPHHHALHHARQLMSWRRASPR